MVTRASQATRLRAVDLQGQLTLVNAARSAGMTRFVFVSFRDDPAIQYPLTQAKRSVERAIADLDFTSVQASYFMELWLSPALGFDCIHGKARIYGSGSKPISWVSYRDVARVLASRRSFVPLAVALCSRWVVPEPSPLEVVRIFEEESGRRFEVETIPEAKSREQFDWRDDSSEKSFAGLSLKIPTERQSKCEGCWSRFPFATSVREYAKTVLEATV